MLASKSQSSTEKDRTAVRRMYSSIDTPSLSTKSFTFSLWSVRNRTSRPSTSDSEQHAGGFSAGPPWMSASDRVAGRPVPALSPGLLPRLMDVRAEPGREGRLPTWLSSKDRTTAVPPTHFKGSLGPTTNQRDVRSDISPRTPPGTTACPKSMHMEWCTFKGW